VESAAIYSLNHFLYAVLYEVKNQVESTPSFLEASLASITCSLIIVRSESTGSQPLPTTISSDPTKTSPEPLSFRENEDGKVSALRSMDGTTNCSRTIDRDV